jgi:hypothetical protein
MYAVQFIVCQCRVLKSDGNEENSLTRPSVRNISKNFFFKSRQIVFIPNSIVSFRLVVFLSLQIVMWLQAHIGSFHIPLYLIP